MSEFMDACGATGPLEWTVERRGSTTVERFTSDQPYLVVGRAPDADLRLPHPEVSDRHAYFQLIDGRLHAVDLGSQAGTYHDGRCRRAGWIEQGSTVRIGPYRLRLVGGNREPRQEARPILSLTLALSHRSIGSACSSWTEPLILIGSSADCQARLLDPSVSAFHAALVQTPGGTWILDLLGKDGVSIHGTKVRLSRFTEADELRIGDSLIRWSSPAPSLEPTTTSPPVPVPTVGAGSTTDLAPLLSGLSADQAELAKSLLGPLTQQFGLMQQHMFERIQEAERRRYQALITLQGEQFASLHEELEQLRELRQEVDELRSALRAEKRLSDDRDSPDPAPSGRPRLGSVSTTQAQGETQALPSAETASPLQLSMEEAS